MTVQFYIHHLVHPVKLQAHRGRLKFCRSAVAYHVGDEFHYALPP